MGAVYKAFISYKHATNSTFARALESALKTYGRPRLSPPPRLFRDEKFIRPGDDLPSAIRSALSQSEFFVLIASKSAAASPWVQDELRQWTADPERLDRLIIVLTEGDIAVDASTQRIVWASTTALPQEFGTAIPYLPLWVDLRGTGEADWSLDNLRFAEAVNAVSAKLRGVSPAEMNDRHVLEHRRTVRLRNATVAVVGLLALGLAAASTFLWFSRKEVIRQRNVAESRRLAGSSTIERTSGRPDTATLLAAEAMHVADTSDARSALLAATQQYIGKEGILVCPDCDITELAFRETGGALPAGLLALGTAKGDIWLKDLRTAGSLTRAGGDVHGAAINALAFNPNGTLLASAGVWADGRLVIWRVEDSGATATLTVRDVHDGMGLAVAFSANGEMLATSRRDGSIVLGAVGQEAFEIRQRVPAHKGLVLSLAFSPDDRRLASGGTDGAVRLWDLDQPLANPRRLAALPAAIGRVEFSPDGRVLAAACHDGSVQTWDVRAAATAATRMKGHRGLVASVAFSADGRTLVSSGADGTVRFWETSTGRESGVPLESNKGTISRTVYLLGRSTRAGDGVFDGSLLASAGGDGQVILWRLDGGGLLQTPFAPGPAKADHVAAGGDVVAIATGTLLHVYYRLANLTLTSSLVMDEHIAAMAVSPDGDLVAAADLGGKVRIWKAHDGTPVGLGFATTPFVHDLAFSPGRQRLAVAAENGVVVWDLVGDRAVGEPLDEHTGEVYSVAYSPDGKWLLSGGRDDTIVIRDAGTLEALRNPIDAHEQGVTALIVPPSSTMAITASFDGTVRRWRLPDGTPIGAPLRGAGAAIHSLALSRDGSTLAAGASDGTIAVWDLVDRQPLGLPIRAHRSEVRSLAFASGGDLLSAAGDGPALSWSMTVDGWTSIAARLAGRNFTCEEWERFVGIEVPYRPTFRRWPSSACPPTEGSPSPISAGGAPGR
jgi:WD40 repeat protein